MMAGLVRRANLALLKRSWRSHNRHNGTYLKSAVPERLVEVGVASYGPLDVRAWGSHNEKLSIGSYVSIAEGVVFVLGGNHQLRWATTFPVESRLQGGTTLVESRGPIVVGDDVWIGRGAMILSGVKIGQGAVVGAGAVVSGSVAPYSIVVGNPAAVVGERFAREVSESLMRIDWATVPPDWLKRHADLVSREVDEDWARSVLPAFDAIGSLRSNT